MQVTNTKKAIKLSIPQDAWMMYQADDQEIVRLDLPAGDAMDAHTNPWNIIFFVLEGEGVLHTDQESFRLEKGDFISVEAGIRRSWENPGRESLELLVIKSKKES